MIIAHPSPREIRGSPGFRELAHSARGHGVVALRRHVCRISVAPEEEPSVFTEVLKYIIDYSLDRFNGEQNSCKTPGSQN